MELIIKPRRAGKTTSLIKMADKNDGYIVCINCAEADRVMRMSKAMGCHINYPITFAEFKNDGYCSAGIGKLYIDNADLLLQYLANVPVKAATLTSGIRENW